MILSKEPKRKKFCLEDVPGLPTDPDEWCEYMEIIIDGWKYRINKFSNLEALSFQWK